MDGMGSFSNKGFTSMVDQIYVEALEERVRELEERLKKLEEIVQVLTFRDTRLA